MAQAVGTALVAGRVDRGIGAAVRLRSMMVLDAGMATVLSLFGLAITWAGWPRDSRTAGCSPAC